MHQTILEQLIFPVQLQDFWNEYWATKPLLISEKDRYPIHLLPSLDDLDRLLVDARKSKVDAVSVLPPPNGDRKHKTFSASSTSWISLYHDFIEGNTIVINSVQRFWPPLARFLAELRSDVKARVSANLYLTPAGQQGFPFHADAHDVLVLQTFGSKEWFIYDTVYRDPLETLEHSSWIDASARNRLSESDAKLVKRSVLRSGDVLYIPRGYYHKAVSLAEEPSLHITISMHPLYLVDLVKAFVETTSADLDLLRATLPQGELIDHNDKLNTALEAITERISETSADRAMSVLRSTRSHALFPPPDGHFRSLVGLPQVRIDTEVERRQGLDCEYLRGIERGVLVFGQRTFRGPDSVQEALRFISKNRRFRVGDLPLPLQMGDQSKVLLAQRLIREGLLRLTPAICDLAFEEKTLITFLRTPLRLQDLLAPLPVDQFLSKYWEKGILQRNGFSTEPRDYFGFGEFDALVWSSINTAGNSNILLVDSDGVTDRPSLPTIKSFDIYDAFLQQKAVVVESAHEIWAPLACLAADTARTLSANVTISVEAAPALWSAPRLEWREYEEIVVQLDGIGLFDIYPSNFKLPYDTAHYRFTLHPDISPIIFDQDVKPAESLRLQPGEAVYIPRGVYRRRRCEGGECCLQLSLQIRPYYWLDYLEAAIEAQSMSNLQLRQSLPPGFIAGTRDQWNLPDRLLSLANKLTNEDAASGLEGLVKLDRWKRRIAPDGHFSHLSKIQDLTISTVIERRIGLDCGVGTFSADRIVLAFAGQRIIGPATLREAFNFVKDQERFRVGDLPVPIQMGDSSKIVLARRLVVDGLMRFAEDQG